MVKDNLGELKSVLEKSLQNKSVFDESNPYQSTQQSRVLPKYAYLRYNRLSQIPTSKGHDD